MNEKPGLVTAMIILPIVSGALNIMAGLGWTIAIVLGTLGFGILCAPLTILPVILGIFEIIYGVNLQNDRAKNTMVIGILEITSFLWGNVISAVIGILMLVFFNDATVKEYFSARAMT
jgi:hypothetical protein